MNNPFEEPNMYKWAEDLFPICRSITGPGVRETLGYIQKLIPDLKIHSIKSGETVFDWQVPLEWTIKDAYIADSSGEKIIDFRVNNLHVVSYSEPVDRTLNLDELQQHLHSIPSQPNAIPYITSYYSLSWGFCITEDQRQTLKNDSYRVVIDSELKSGVLNYADLVIKGQTKKEVFLSTYICHPSMGNNELSGPVVATALAKWAQALNNPYYTYRFVFIPETIGSIVYLSQHIEHLKKNVIGGFNITCVGDERSWGLVTSRYGNNISDQIGEYILKTYHPNFIKYSWLDRGSDERQYCAPGVDLPISSITRSKYGEYPEYHTSLDNFDVVTQKGLNESLEIYLKCIDIFEKNFATYCGTKYAVTTSNGTTALHLALVSFGIGPGDEVIIPDLTFIATANAVKYTGAKIVTVDIDKDTLCINIDEVKKSITKNTKAIIPVHLYGHPAAMIELNEIAKNHDLIVIEDAAEAHGAEINSIKVGGFGHAGTFSFYGNKVLTTGEGGMVTTNDKNIYERLKYLRDHAMDPDKRYWHKELGFNYRMTNLQAALGVAQLERIDEILDKKKKIFQWYEEQLYNEEKIKLNFQSDGYKNVFWVVCIEIKGFDEEKRDTLIMALKDSGIDSRPFLRLFALINGAVG